ncbi:hypothetical protein D910_00384 [Dendroctonus ponderosae]|uniref:Reverse transcriptase domain-containing protein n=1 Tax=Dendroctonus ponderosae TaxID=77166 RepID=U4UZL9_DENPD|nr:hypothetical protein D910_00384 [Dendroctonus ponderosae]
MPECLVEITNSYANTVITNTRDNPISITLTEPLNVELINESEVNFIDQPDENIEFEYQDLDKKQKENLKNLRLKHCNNEEYQAIRNLCYEYRDIFYVEGTPLTFTNQIKHKIKTTDESPIFTKTYRYPEVHKPEVKRQIQEMLRDGIIQNSN